MSKDDLLPLSSLPFGVFLSFHGVIISHIYATPSYCNTKGKDEA